MRLAIYTHQMFEGIVGLGDACAAERVCLDKVRARLQVRLVDPVDDVGPRQRQQVVVALEVLGMVLELIACTSVSCVRHGCEAPA
jgi:hypothetical protein